MTFVPMLCRSLTLTVIYMPHVVWFVTGVLVPASGTLVLWSVMLIEWYINTCTWCTSDLVCDTMICTWCTHHLVCDADSDMHLMYVWPGLWRWQWYAHDVYITWFVTLTVICTWCTYDLVCDADSDMHMMYIWPGLWHWQWYAHDLVCDRNHAAWEQCPCCVEVWSATESLCCVGNDFLPKSQ